MTSIVGVTWVFTVVISSQIFVISSHFGFFVVKTTEIFLSQRIMDKFGVSGKTAQGQERVPTRGTPNGINSYFVNFSLLKNTNLMYAMMNG